MQVAGRVLSKHQNSSPSLLQQADILALLPDVHLEMVEWNISLQCTTCPVSLRGKNLIIQPVSIKIGIGESGYKSSVSLWTQYKPVWDFHISICCSCHWDEILVHSVPEAIVASPTNPSLVRTTNRKSLDCHRRKIPAPYDWKYWTLKSPVHTEFTVKLYVQVLRQI